MKTVKILGSGCANCRKLEAVAREAAADAGIEAEFVKVTDMKAIMAYDCCPRRRWSSTGRWSAAAASRRKPRSGNGWSGERTEFPADQLRLGCRAGRRGGVALEPQ
jgi:hypothetical protein